MEKILNITVYLPYEDIEDDVQSHIRRWEDTLTENYTEFDLIVKINFVISKAITVPKLEFFSFEAPLLKL